mmetsp:Transcript_2048/g.6821  ORF Transcript_2048/g.6821 Transcript_2048/m.6821 type:complete len:269 (+) Transcript_2048:167-973(+)
MRYATAQGWDERPRPLGLLRLRPARRAVEVDTNHRHVVKELALVPPAAHLGLLRQLRGRVRRAARLADDGRRLVVAHKGPQPVARDDHPLVLPGPDGEGGDLGLRREPSAGVPIAERAGNGRADGDGAPLELCAHRQRPPPVRVPVRNLGWLAQQRRVRRSAVHRRLAPQAAPQATHLAHRRLLARDIGDGSGHLCAGGQRARARRCGRRGVGPGVGPGRRVPREDGGGRRAVEALLTFLLLAEGELERLLAALDRLVQRRAGRRRRR